MCPWIVLLAACSLPQQTPDAKGGPRPESTVVKADEYEKEVDRLEKIVSKLGDDETYLEALLARKKAEVEAAKVDLWIYRLTHRIDPARGAASPARSDNPGADELVELPSEREKKQAKVESELVTLRGRVVDAEGRAMAGVSVVVVDPNKDENPPQTKTDPNGDYSIIIPGPFGRRSFCQIKYEAKGHARRVVGIGEHGCDQRRLIKLEPGVSLGGSIVHQGRNVPKVKVYLIPEDGTYPGFLGEWTSITDDLGHFTFDDLPAGLEATLSFDIDSLKHLGAIGPRAVRTPPTGGPRLLVDPIEVGPSLKVGGQVIFRDGKKLPAGSNLYLRIEGSWSGQTVKLGADGRFEVVGMPPGLAMLSVGFPNNEYAPKGYRLSAENVSLDHSYPWRLSGRLDRDISDLKILFEPGPAWKTAGSGTDGQDIPIDQANLEAEPLAGIPASGPRP